MEHSANHTSLLYSSYVARARSRNCLVSTLRCTHILYRIERDQQSVRPFNRLVATLGSKSTASKVNRKAILDVDVAKACGMIVRPEAPMALRLQGNLL